MKIPYQQTYWVIENKLLAGKTPYRKNKQETYNNLAALIDNNFDLIINLTEEGEFSDYENELMFFAHGAQKNIQVIRKSIPDKELMCEILNIMDTALNENKKVFVHCYGGIGRTGTVIGCFLIENKYADKENIFDKISELRKGLRITYSPETDEQKQFVLDWGNP
ncbi:MAG: dual specificity protein phosphatase family protein [Bacteroidales bacterium]|nr:dual specificity protein phosphatase family protein [Bacteroidales bacterium]